MAETKPNIGSDIPSDAILSSVGALVWPPQETNEQRRKGIRRQVITDFDALSQVVQEFNHLPFTPDITRNTGRIFISGEVLRQGANQIPELDSLVEGLIPLAGCGVSQLDDCYLVYLGNNAPERMLSQNQVEQELDLARSIFTQPESAKSHDHDNYQFMTVNEEMRQNQNMQDQFLQLYSAFGWNADDVGQLLANHNNLLLGVFHEGQLVSTGMAEQVVIPLSRDNEEFSFIMHEITEAATAEAHRGNGLYTAVARQINYALAQTATNLVYAESNLEAPGVLKAAARQGRQTTLDQFAQFGFTPKPLRQAVRITSGNNDTRPPNLKNDLLVTYLTREQLLQQYGNQNN